jgi:hypothetical protein
MDFLRPLGITSAFLFLSLFFGASDSGTNVPVRGGGTGVTASVNGKSKGGVKLLNKSPCLYEDVYECQASGGTFNWSHCTCMWN